MSRDRAQRFAIETVKRAKRRGMTDNEDDVLQSVFDSIWKEGAAPDLIVWGYERNSNSPD
jgi:hypothetical protein